MSFLPDNYQKPTTSGGSYFKPAKGENRVRIVTSPVVGYIDWDYTGDKPKPVRTRDRQTALSDRATPKHFWAMGVLHDGEVKVWEVTQASIQDSLIALAKNEEWGNPMEYDITITRTGDSMETKYSILPQPKKDITPEQGEAIDNMSLNLEALFEGENPFES